MRHVEIRARAPGRSADQVYEVLSDFDAYPKFASVVRSVRMERTGENVVKTDWEVDFRDGILKWTEEDRFFPDRHAITFKQLEGDVDYFVGEWAVEDEDGGCLVSFVADLDLGIPGLGDMLEPIAEQALEENIRNIVAGLVGEPVEFLPAASRTAG